MLNLFSVAENVLVTAFQQLKEKVLTCQYIFFFLQENDTFYAAMA